MKISALNDGTKGKRITSRLGTYIIRMRQEKSRCKIWIGRKQGRSTNALYLGKLAIYTERKGIRSHDKFSNLAG